MPLKGLLDVDVNAVWRNRLQRNARRRVQRIAIHADGNAAERDGTAVVLHRLVKAVPVAFGEDSGLVELALVPDRADRMDDVLRRKVESRRLDRLAGLTGAAEVVEIPVKAVAGGIVYGPVHPAAAHQGRVGRIDDGVRLLKDDAVMNDLNRFHRLSSFRLVSLCREVCKNPPSESTARCDIRVKAKLKDKISTYIRKWPFVEKTKSSENSSVA